MSKDISQITPDQVKIDISAPLEQFLQQGARHLPNLAIAAEIDNFEEMKSV